MSSDDSRQKVSQVGLGFQPVPLIHLLSRKLETSLLRTEALVGLRALVRTLERLAGAGGLSSQTPSHQPLTTDNPQSPTPHLSLDPKIPHSKLRSLGSFCKGLIKAYVLFSCFFLQPQKLLGTAVLIGHGIHKALVFGLDQDCDYDHYDYKCGGAKKSGILR